MKGYVFVSPAGLRSEKALKKWIDRALAFVSALPDGKKDKRKQSNTHHPQKPAQRGRRPAGKA